MVEFRRSSKKEIYLGGWNGETRYSQNLEMHCFLLVLPIRRGCDQSNPRNSFVALLKTRY